MLVRCGDSYAREFLVVVIILVCPYDIFIILSHCAAFPPPLHVCMCALFRGKLRRGEHTLHLWKISEAQPTANEGTKLPSKETKVIRRSSHSKKSFVEMIGAQWSQILVGPAACNPSPLAIRATLALPEEDVYCPSTAKQSREPFM